MHVRTLMLFFHLGGCKGFNVEPLLAQPEFLDYLVTKTPFVSEERVIEILRDQKQNSHTWDTRVICNPEENTTVIHSAICHRRAPVLRALLEAGVDPNEMANENTSMNGDGDDVPVHPVEIALKLGKTAWLKVLLADMRTNTATIRRWHGCATKSLDVRRVLRHSTFDIHNLTDMYVR